MGLFSKKKQCDWCGKKFKGDGVEDGGMLLCSAECLAQKNAPPIAASTTPPREPSIPRVISDLATARSMFNDFLQSVDYLSRATGGPEIKLKIQETEVAEMEAWRNLNDAAGALRSLGADTAEYEELLDSGFASSERPVKTGAAVVKGPTLHPQIAYRARFGDVRASIDVFEAAYRALELQMGKLPAS
jgi:hypothetical protein